MSFPLIFRIQGFLLLFIAASMAFPAAIALSVRETALQAFCYAVACTAGAGLALILLCPATRKQISHREGFLIVALGWMLAAVFGSLPFLFDKSLTGFTDAYFETVSGFTTTGATVLSDVESLPRSILFWRSMIQWLGGMGIIVLSIAILPFLVGSVAAARGGLASDFDVILHMPMEPRGRRTSVRENVAVFSDSDDRTVRKRLNAALDSLPVGLVDINNHMGSLFTERGAKLAVVMDELAKRNLFFVDSVTSAKSVAFDVALRHGLTAGRRNFEFIDNKPDARHAIGQFKQLIATASSKPMLITIMHDRKHSVTALETMLPAIRKAGIELTYAAELLERPTVALATDAARHRRLE